MRITAGTHRSRNLKTLNGDQTRPTTDKIRQAIFSRIGPYFNNTSFLDVFSGSGAMALEARSRGVEVVYALEQHSGALSIIKDNAKSLNESIEILKGDAMQLIPSLKQKFDYIFIDPPYHYDKFQVVIETCIQNCVHEDTLIIVESDISLKLDETILNFECVHEKKYGQTRIRYYEVNHGE